MTTFGLFAAVASFHAGAQVVSFGPEIGQLSFEDGKYPAQAGRGSKISVSDRHAKFGTRSLQWDWRKPSSELILDVQVPYLHENPNPKETSVSTFVFWVYSPEVLEGKLEFSFYKDGRKCSSFTYNLGFDGWRGSWVAFDRDMLGAAAEGMDRIVVTSPADVKKGTLFFDGIIPSSFQDIRHHSPDWQTPFVNKDTKSHWLVLNNSWNNVLDIKGKESLSAEDIQDMALVEERFKTLVSGHVPVKSIGELRKIYESYTLSENGDGTIKGKPVFFIRYGETFINLGIKDAAARFGRNGQLLRSFNDNMLRFAVAYIKETDPQIKAEIADMYVNLTRHILDQGFAAGSGLGTVHHLGYSMRNFYTAPVLMKEVLVKAGLDEKMQQAMEWFSGVGEVKKAPAGPGIDIDAFNTSLMGRMASILMLRNTPYKYAYMQALRRWVDNGFKYTGGTSACFKTDGTVYHHRKAYPAYATGGFDGAVNAVWMFSNTSLAISEESHRILKNALLEMRFYCNKKSFPLAMSGRHPDGKGGLIPHQYALLADAGSPDGKEAVDRELAAAYLRLDGESKEASKFISQGITAEDAPEGTHVYGYNCSMSHRNDNWLVTFAGHSRYLWAVEIYNKCNHYGRYIAHGSMQYLSEQGSYGSGFAQEGWDWCHIPGATAVEIPMTEMKADVRNVDVFSGYEEMLLSDEWFAGGVSHKGKYGAYAMKLHEHDKYNGSLRANKSYFAFDNRIVALGSGLENGLEASGLHTTLFQNSVDGSMPTVVNGKEIHSLEYEEILDGNNMLRDRLGNAYFVRNAEIRVFRTRQHSLHEETDAPTEGLFEKAYINHGVLCGKDVEGCDDDYEYMVLIQPETAQIEEYGVQLPYKVLKCDRTAHVVRDIPSGVTACAAYEETVVDSLVLRTTPAMLMYSAEGDRMLLSVSNPDLALYEGPSDEVYDEAGKRVERSVYSRTWIDSPSREMPVTVVLKGEWRIPESHSRKVTAEVNGGNTVLHFLTSEAKTEEILLERNDS